MRESRQSQKAPFVKKRCFINAQPPSKWCAYAPASFQQAKKGNAFYRAGFIESWGRGIKKITDACKSYGINNPKYSILPSSVTVEFDSNITQENTQEIAQENLSKKQKEILGLIESDPNITREAIAKRTGFSSDSVKYNLDVLKKKGILSREGSTKNGKWVIKQLVNSLQGAFRSLLIIFLYLFPFFLYFSGLLYYC